MGCEYDISHPTGVRLFQSLEVIRQLHSCFEERVSVILNVQASVITSRYEGQALTGTEIGQAAG